MICRRDSFITHRAFCDILAQEAAKSQPSTTAEDADAVKDDEVPRLNPIAQDADAMKDIEAVPLLNPPPLPSSPLLPNTPTTGVLSPSSPLPPNTPTTGVLSPVLSIQSSGNLSYSSFYVVHIVHVKLVLILFCSVQLQGLFYLLGFVYLQCPA